MPKRLPSTNFDNMFSDQLPEQTSLDMTDDEEEFTEEELKILNKGENL